MLTLSAALEQHQLTLPADQMAQLEQYVQQLWAWNEKLNLTRHTDYEKFVGRDVCDSWAISQALGECETVLDVGTGGGVPGVVVAILRPDVGVSLIDSVGKKAKAVQEIVRALQLPIPVFNERAEQHLEENQYDTLILRAVAPIAKLLGWFAPVQPSFHRILLLKGPAWKAEWEEAKQKKLIKPWTLREVSTRAMWPNESQSVLLELQRK